MHLPTKTLADDACADFVQWLTSRTLQGRTRWDKHPNGLISHLPGSMFAQFITHASEQGQDWSLFRVRDAQGELFRARALATANETAPLAAAVQALFFAVMWGGLHLIH